MSMIVVGASGYIGSCLLSAAPDNSWGTATKHVNANEVVFDLKQPESFPWNRLQYGDVILLTAAVSSPDICSKNHDLAWSINVTGTSSFVEKAISRGARIIFFSSDTVYGEKTDEFDESATCNPSGEYAKMKHEVENRFKDHAAFKSIRLSYVFSRDDKFTRYLKKCADTGESAEIFHPFYRAIIHRGDVIAGVIALAQRWDEFPYQVINFGGPDVVTRTEFTQILKENALPTIRFNTIEPEAEYFLNRPRVIKMKSPILVSLLSRPQRSLKEAALIEFN